MGGAGAEPVPAAYRGHREQHYAATAWAVDSLVDRRRVERIVLPVEDRAAAQLYDQLSPDFPGVSSASCPALATSLATNAEREAAHLAQSEGAAAVDRLLGRGRQRGQVIERGYEGYVAKDEASPYEGGPARRWLKVKVPGWTVEEDCWQRRIDVTPAVADRRLVPGSLAARLT
jgi:hypothetical protein